MGNSSGIAVGPARRQDAGAIAAFLRTVPRGPAGTPAAGYTVFPDVRRHVVAVAGSEIIGTCLVIPGAGRCAAVPPPRMLEWDGDVAARLIRAAGALAHQTHGARLIQSLIDPDGAQAMTAALEAAGFEPLAMLSYLRRGIGPVDVGAEDRPDLAWQRYSFLRHRRFADTIARTYEGSLDCPKLAGLREIDDTVETHKRTGRFSPKTWRLAVADRQPRGVAMVNELQGRAELIYLGVVPEARGRGIGRALLAQAMRDATTMGLTQVGLAVDVNNIPATRLYAGAGFTEVRRRLAWFVPAGRLASLAD
ncbi:MAG TPA: GNAT family N-acetyltransferase [Phycisphaerae bacterium]|nr:GNAT family N-acetyltransferase [Phycisphaerae bacterium]